MDVNKTCHLGETGALKALKRGHFRCLLELCRLARRELDLRWDKEMPEIGRDELAESEPRFNLQLSYLIREAFGESSLFYGVIPIMH